MEEAVIFILPDITSAPSVRLTDFSPSLIMRVLFPPEKEIEAEKSIVHRVSMKLSAIILLFKVKFSFLYRLEGICTCPEVTFEVCPFKAPFL